MGFCFFLKAFSWETDLWVTPGNLMVKTRKFWKGNLYLTYNRFGSHWTGKNEKLDSLLPAIKFIG